MMLRHAPDIDVTMRQKRLQVFLDVMLKAELLAQFDHSERVAFPIQNLRHGKIIDSADLQQVNEFMSLAHDLQTALDIERRLKADPCEYPGAVELAQSFEAVGRKRSLRFPLLRKLVIERGQGRSEEHTSELQSHL